MKPSRFVQDRWGHVGLGIINYHGGFNATYLPVLDWLDNKVPPSAWDKLDPLMNALQAAYGEYDTEMRGFFSAVIAEYPWANSSGIFTFDKVGCSDTPGVSRATGIAASLLLPRSLGTGS